ncbi:MAG: BsuPI-related putative proteinase inhibitor, partial [Steroidobacteraceae bacterium]
DDLEKSLAKESRAPLNPGSPGAFSIEYAGAKITFPATDRVWGGYTGFFQTRTGTFGKSAGVLSGRSRTEATIAPMAIRIPLPRLLTVLGVMGICLGASSSSCDFGGSSNGDRGSPSFVADLTLRTSAGSISDTFDQGDEIELTLTVRNRLNSAATVQFPSARTSDFVVVRENSADVVWKWSADRAFAQVVTELDFEAGETKTVRVIWNQLDDSGMQVPAGPYEARGVLVYEGFDSNPLRSDQFGSTLERFTIR